MGQEQKLEAAFEAGLAMGMATPLTDEQRRAVELAVKAHTPREAAA